MNETTLIAKLPEANNNGTCIICKTADGYIMKNEFANGQSTKWNEIGGLELKHTILMLHFGMTEAQADKFMA